MRVAGSVGSNPELIQMLEILQEERSSTDVQSQVDQLEIISMPKCTRKLGSSI
jgi:hypothetical protein